MTKGNVLYVRLDLLISKLKSKIWPTLKQENLEAHLDHLEGDGSARQAATNHNDGFSGICGSHDDSRVKGMKGNGV